MFILGPVKFEMPIRHLIGDMKSRERKYMLTKGVQSVKMERGGS